MQLSQELRAFAAAPRFAVIPPAVVPQHQRRIPCYLSIETFVVHGCAS
jgi:hypothetical protein